MRKIVSSLCAAIVAFSMPVTAPAAAMPVHRNLMEHSLVTEAQHRPPPRDARRAQPPRRDVYRASPRRGFYRQGNYAYYNGHRGYRERRPGYRHHNGWWFPPAAFIAGAIVGGAISGSHGPVHSDAHLRWCYDRYRSYRASDNTFQPYQGPRRQCVSPYMR